MTSNEIQFKLKNGWQVILPASEILKIQVKNEKGDVMWERKSMSDIPWPKYWLDSTRSRIVEEGVFLYVNGDDGVRLCVACSFAPLQVIFDLRSGDVLGISDAR
jgi:hypothetical protein